MLYYYVLDENTFITHDGYVQLGIHHNLDYFKQNIKVDIQETHWIPDTFDKRYKRTNFQKHLQHQGQLPKEINDN